MYSEQIFKTDQNDKCFSMGLCFAIEFCSFQNIVLWCIQRKIQRQLKFSWKLSCGGLNYVLLKSVRNLFLANKSVNRSLKKRATKCAIRLILWTVTLRNVKLLWFYTSKHGCKTYLIKVTKTAMSKSVPFHQWH